MTDITFLPAKQNSAARYRARRAEKRVQEEAESRLARKVSAASAGGSFNVAKSLSAPNWRNRPEQVSQCMPDVAIYSAGHRTKGDRITCTGRQKSRGRSIPLV